MEEHVRPDEREEVKGGSRYTIFALSSGSPPAAVAVIRISGPGSTAALQQLIGRQPPPRRATMAVIRDPASGDEVDRGLVLFFPGPRSATGEDVAELHLHGGRSVVAAMLNILSDMSELRAAQAGEFTRRSFENGRIDLAEAEGLADLLAAETDSQRRTALAMAGGSLSRLIASWQERMLSLAAELEAALDFADEGDVDETRAGDWRAQLIALRAEINHLLARPTVERLREGVRVVISGPPNSGKSSLLNALVGRDAAITSPIAGTTRDLIEAPSAIGGTPFLLIDTAGLRDSEEEIESIGVDRARVSLGLADIILWLGPPRHCPDVERSIIVQSKADLAAPREEGTDLHVSAVTGHNLDQLIGLLTARAARLLPKEGEVAVNVRQRAAIAEASAALIEAEASDDLLIQAESLRESRVALDRITGRAGVEDMLDVLFGRFCIGK